MTKRYLAIGIASSIFLLCGIAYFVFWLTWGRFHEYTNDAYVDGNMVMITPLVPGIVNQITSQNVDFVTVGRPLVQLDTTDASIALDASVAQLGSAVRTVVQWVQRVQVIEAQVAVKRAHLIRRALDYEHRKLLINTGSISLEDFEHAEAALNASFAAMIEAENEWISAYSLIENTTIETHPHVEEAKQKVRDRYVSLQRCLISSPVTGIVAQRKVQVGQWVNPGAPLMAVVPLDQIWVNANFKETQLAKMRVGQPVTVTSDMYGRDVIYHGKVAGLPGGTGSVFSVLPPQNATGNWIKIVQRLPVRIELDSEEVACYPLRLGLSLEVTVDVHNPERGVIPEETPITPLFQTEIFNNQEEGVEELIEAIISMNLSPTFLEQ